ncbi:PRC-barrel domain-containing protein [Schumannella soli]|uniref:PRC-barrel domain containing protein n=1 Tax=Schumannella soli TaxID=2590779 RepID=A0A506XXK1_9MICO|nr:PRC-barrel domain containing protein [Schumannella soli]TPW77491.1 PRC-barrel domain containing protein [Schumannella soli]
MLLTELLRMRVVEVDGTEVGRVVDARFRIDAQGGARLVGLIVSPHTRAPFLGYERAALDEPLVLDRFLRWLHRGSFLVDWPDVRRLDDDGLHLREGYERRPSTLP